MPVDKRAMKREGRVVTGGRGWNLMFEAKATASSKQINFQGEEMEGTNKCLIH